MLYWISHHGFVRLTMMIGVIRVRQFCDVLRLKFVEVFISLIVYDRSIGQL